MSRINDALKRAAGVAHANVDGAAAATTIAPDGSDALGGAVAADFFPAEEPLAPAELLAPLPAPAEKAHAAPPALETDVDRLLRQVEPGSIEKLVIGAMPGSSFEQYRRLGAALHQAQLNTGLRVVMVASAVAAEGKTLTSANLALTLSESYRRRVLLIDADLRRPSLHRLFGLSNEDGLTDALRSERERKVSTRALSPTLSVLTSGRSDTEQMAHLTSSRMRQLIEEASQLHDWVIIDTPPVALLSDAKLLGTMVDGALLVVRAGATPYPVVQRAIQALGPERIVGTVLNGVDAADVEDRAYHYGYYAAESPRKRPWWRRAEAARHLVRGPAEAPGPAGSE